MSPCAGMLPSTLPTESYMERLCTLDAQWWLVTPLLSILATELSTWVPFWNRLTKCLWAIWTIEKTVQRPGYCWVGGVQCEQQAWFPSEPLQCIHRCLGCSLQQLSTNLNTFIWMFMFWPHGRGCDEKEGGNIPPYFTVIYLLQCLHFTSYDKQWEKTKNMLL